MCKHDTQVRHKSHGNDVLEKQCRAGGPLQINKELRYVPSSHCILHTHEKLWIKFNYN